jgi:hypothetical protein
VSAACCASAWHSVGDGSIGGDDFFMSSLPVGWGWWCAVVGVFVLFRSVRVVVSASTRHVQLLFFLNDRAVLSAIF